MYPREQFTAPRSRRRATAALVALALVVVAACDDDGSGTASSTTPPASNAGTGAIATGSTPPPASPPGEPVLTLGFLDPGAGLTSALVIGQQRGLRLAIDDVNAAGGVLGGPLATVSATESADVALATTVDGLVGQGAKVLLGPVGSDSAAALLPILAERKLLACSASATATSLTSGADTSAPPAFVRTALRDDHTASIVADQIMAAQGDTPAPKSVMVVGRDDTYGSELSAGLSAELAARGAAVTTLGYPSRRVQFPDESAAVAAAKPDRVVLLAFEEGPRLVADIAAAGYPVGQIVGLDGMLVPRLAEQAFPSNPGAANDLTVIGTTGDRALMNRLRQVPAPQDQVSYGPQMYDCVITLALAAIASGSVEPGTIAAQISAVTAGGRTCSTFAHCVELLAAGEDIDYDGTTGHIAVDAAGDISTARVTTARVIDGQLQPTASQDVDLEAQRQDAIFANAVFVAQLQQALKVLGYYDGDITGIYDDATTAAVAALQRDLGLPETGQYDDATDAALRERLGGRLATFGTGVKELQQALADRGFYDGPIDGRYSAATIAAVEAFQTSLGVPATGIVDVATLQAIYAQGVATGAASVPPPPEPTTTPPTTTTPPPPPPPPPTAPKPPPTTAAPTTTAKPPTSEPSDEPPEAEAPAPGEDLYDVLAGDGRFSTLAAIARTAGYGRDFAEPGPLTLFAPTDEAFGELDDAEVDRLRTDPTAANDLLRDLVVDERLSSSQLTTGPQRVISGATVDVTVADGTITFGGAEVTGPDIDASNGVAHAVSAVPHVA
jgi:branched-chain amino acid transport system substrate-binding protein